MVRGAAKRGQGWMLLLFCFTCSSVTSGAMSCTTCMGQLPRKVSCHKAGSQSESETCKTTRSLERFESHRLQEMLMLLNCLGYETAFSKKQNPLCGVKRCENAASGRIINPCVSPG